MTHWLCSLSLLAALLVGQATAATFYVAPPPTGNNSRTCTQAQSPSTPRATINQGIACMSGGDTLLIGDGAYHELLTNYSPAQLPGVFSYVQSIPSGSAGAYTTIRAQNRRQVTLTAPAAGDISGNIYLELSAHHVHMEGFVLDGQNHDPNTGTGISTGDDTTASLRFKDMLIRHARGTAVGGSGSGHEFIDIDMEYIAQTAAGTSTCHPATCNDPENPTCMGYCHGYYMSGTGHVMLGGTYTHMSGYVYHYSQGGSGPHIYNGGRIEDAFGVAIMHQGSTLMNCTAKEVFVGVIMSSGSVVHNSFTLRTRQSIPSSSPVLIMQNSAGGVSTVKNNLLFNFSGASPYIYIESGSGNILDSGPHANVQGNVCDHSQNGCTFASSGSCFVVNPGAGNFNLCANSPAISAGVNPGGGFTPDQAGNARPQAGFDAGAREFMGTGTPVATALAFVQQPSSTQEDVVITPAITVRVIDQFGAVFSSTALITLTIGTNPGSSTLGGDPTKNVSGLTPANFNDVTINNPGTGYTLVASSPGLTSATSAAFTITPAGTPPVATALEFLQALGPVPEDEVFGVTVRVLDQFGVLFPSTASVTIAIGTNPGSSTLSGTLTRTASAGTTVFNDLALNNPGTGYTLVASSPGLTSATSTPFTITPVGTPVPPGQVFIIQSGLFLGR